MVNACISQQEGWVCNLATTTHHFPPTVQKRVLRSMGQTRKTYLELQNSYKKIERMNISEKYVHIIRASTISRNHVEKALDLAPLQTTTLTYIECSKTKS